MKIICKMLKCNGYGKFYIIADTNNGKSTKIIKIIK